jgi:1-acyl-sn-glycerol-3-phosphate acyltransferase
VNASETYRVSFGNRIGRGLIRGVGGLLYRTLARVTITGLENVPADGAYLIAFNHISIFEPPFLLTLWPTAPEAIGAVEVWHEPDKKLLARMYGGIPLDRDQVSREPLIKAVQALNSGHALLISPEGRLTRQPGLRRAKWGIAFLAEKARVPIVPVGVVGSTQDFLKRVVALKRPGLEMRIGKPFHLPTLDSVSPDRREALQKNADQVMLHIAALLPSEYRGVYDTNSFS